MTRREKYLMSLPENRGLSLVQVKRKNGAKAREAARCGKLGEVELSDAESVSERSGIEAPKAENGKVKTKDLAEYHGKMAAHHEGQSGFGKQLVHKWNPFHRDFYNSFNPLHKNLWTRALDAGSGAVSALMDAHGNSDKAAKHRQLASHYAAMHHAGKHDIAWDESKHPRDEQGEFT